MLLICYDITQHEASGKTNVHPLVNGNEKGKYHLSFIIKIDLFHSLNYLKASQGTPLSPFTDHNSRPTLLDS